MHEQHVDVAGVVQLASAELAHADDRESDVGIDDGERGFEADLREGGELPADAGHVGRAEEVAHRDAQQLASLPATERTLVAVVLGFPRDPIGLDRVLARELVRVA